MTSLQGEGLPRFAKYQAMGNDYLVVDPEDALPAAPATAVAMCDRHFGIGADGIVFRGPPAGAGQPMPVRLFNPDGSPCERSANGLRILALHLSRGGGTEFVLDTGFGRTSVRVLDRSAGLVSIDLGRPDFDADAVGLVGGSGPVVDHPLPVAGRTLRVTCVHNGNPHAVVVLPADDESAARELGPLIVRHSAFRTRVNVEFAVVRDRSSLEVVVWERGAGPVLASGSGACAAAAAVRRLGLVGDEVDVRMRGGAVTVSVDAGDAVRLTGPVEEVATGRVSAGLAARAGRPTRPVPTSSSS
ncbi:diaminopimelate epimerase [Micromonospora noduli]|uniref:diaminopimelate epimerase n=1 Tax=Micromonospora noduli TaxID=709876 RepID=UPI000DC38494|nr:diaminopimelate epimerase [Micromonospora noduli]RAO07995.1 Diaminopimelate epimerase [Micromonospora noduli]